MTMTSERRGSRSAISSGCVAGSIILGKRGLRLSQWPRYALYSATTVLVIFGLAGFTTADSNVREPGFNGVSSYQGNPYDSINDLFVYDEQGKLVPNARIFDQNGAPVQFGGGWCTDPSTGESWHTRNLGYPYCPQDAPFGPTPSAAVPSENAAEPSGSATPSGNAAPSGSATPPGNAAPPGGATSSGSATPSERLT